MIPTGKHKSLYHETAREMADLVVSKQKAYGDSFGKSGYILKQLYPDGIKPEQLEDALTITRIIDKLFRIATKKDAFGESPWRDIMGYALLASTKDGIKRVQLHTFCSPIQNWDKAVNGWKDLPRDKKYKVINEGIDMAWKSLADARKQALETRSPSKHTNLVSKRNGASNGQRKSHSAITTK